MDSEIKGILDRCVLINVKGDPSQGGHSPGNLEKSGNLKVVRENRNRRGKLFLHA